MNTLELYTEFETVVAQHLAYYRNRDEPNKQDLNDAVKMSVEWNKQREDLNLRPFK